MRHMLPVLLMAGGLLAAGPAAADWVPPVKGNDTSVIISYSLGPRTPFKAIAVDHCAQYGKVARYGGAQRVYGGYVSYRCVWVPPGHYSRPLSVRY